MDDLLPNGELIKRDRFDGRYPSSPDGVARVPSAGKSQLSRGRTCHLPALSWLHPIDEGVAGISGTSYLSSRPVGASFESATASRGGRFSSASASSLRMIASLTMCAPTKRIGSGGKERAGAVRNPHCDHSSSRPSAREARILPPTTLGPTPLPDHPTP